MMISDVILLDAWYRVMYNHLGTRTGHLGKIYIYCNQCGILRRKKLKKEAVIRNQRGYKYQTKMTLHGWGQTTPTAFHAMHDSLKGYVRVDGINLERRFLVVIFINYFLLWLIQLPRLFLGSFFTTNDVRLSNKFVKIQCRDTIQRDIFVVKDGLKI